MITDNWWVCHSLAEESYRTSYSSLHSCLYSMYPGKRIEPSSQALWGLSYFFCISIKTKMLQGEIEQTSVRNSRGSISWQPCWTWSAEYKPHCVSLHTSPQISQIKLPGYLPFFTYNYTYLCVMCLVAFSLIFIYLSLFEVWLLPFDLFWGEKSKWYLTFCSVFPLWWRHFWHFGTVIVY